MKNFLFALRYLRKLRGGTFLARVVSLSLGLAVGLLVFSYANYNAPPTVSPTGADIQLWAHYADPQHSGYNSQAQCPIAPAEGSARSSRHACSGHAHRHRAR